MAAVRQLDDVLLSARQGCRLGTRQTGIGGSNRAGIWLSAVTTEEGNKSADSRTYVCLRVIPETHCRGREY
jgi:hypothetical protein